MGRLRFSSERRSFQDGGKVWRRKGRGHLLGLKMEVAEAAESEPDFENRAEQGEKCTEVNCEKGLSLKAGI